MKENKNIEHRTRLVYNKLFIDGVGTNLTSDVHVMDTRAREIRQSTAQLIGQSIRVLSLNVNRSLGSKLCDTNFMKYYL
jgi:hypothetical protein